MLVKNQPLHFQQCEKSIKKRILEIQDINLQLITKNQYIKKLQKQLNLNIVDFVSVAPPPLKCPTNIAEQIAFIQFLKKLNIQAITKLNKQNVEINRLSKLIQQKGFPQLIEHII